MNIPYNMSTNIEESSLVSISKEALTVMVQLIQLAQKKGAYTLDESYLAFNAINSIVDDPKFKRTKELVETLFNKSNVATNSTKTTNSNTTTTDNTTTTINEVVNTRE